jgi:hypothetical protein
MPLSAPPSIEKEHEEILELMIRIQHLSGKTGSLAEKLAKDLKPHIDKEEALALPLLGILRDIAQGRLKNGPAKKAAVLCSKFEKEYAAMVRTHAGIRGHLERLKKFGLEEGHPTALRFAETLDRHSREEEEIFYPAALLAGKAAVARARPGH